MSDSSSAVKAVGGSSSTSPGQTGRKTSFADIIRKTYDMKLALSETDPLREESYRLRYQAYCIENAFEPIAENPGERETDEYDLQSLHGLLVYRATDMVVGTARLILPELNGSAIPLPIRKVCAPQDMAAADARIGSHRVAEISRFAIAKQLRRQAEHHARLASGLAKTDAPATRRVTPHISLGLMQAVVAMARLGEIRFLYAVMEPALLRMLQCLGIDFENLGPTVEYHGKRQPCYCELDQLLAGTWAVRPEVWEVLTDHGRIWPLHHYRARPLTDAAVDA